MQDPSDGVRHPFSNSVREDTTNSENTDDQYITMASFSEDLGAANCRVAVPHMADSDLMGVDDDRDWCADSMAVELSSVESAAMNGIMKLLKPGGSDDPTSMAHSGLSFSRSTSFLRRNTSVNGLSLNLSHENVPDNNDDYSITSFYSGPSNRNQSDKCSAEGEEEDPMLPMAPPSSPIHSWQAGTSFYSVAPSPPGYAHITHAPADVALEHKWWTGGALSTSMYSLPRGLYTNDNSTAGTLHIEVPRHNGARSVFPNGWVYEDTGDNSDSGHSVATSLFVEVASLDGEGTYARYGEACADEDVPLRDSLDGGLEPLYDSSDSRDLRNHNESRSVLPCVPYYLAETMHHRAGQSVHSVTSPPDAPVRRRYNTPEHEECGSAQSDTLERVVLKTFSTDRLVALQYTDPSYRHFSGFSSHLPLNLSSNISNECKAGYYGNDTIMGSKLEVPQGKPKHRRSSGNQKLPGVALRNESGGSGSVSSARSSTKRMTQDVNMTVAAGKRKRSENLSGCSPVSALSNEHEGYEHANTRSGLNKKRYTQNWYSNSTGAVPDPNSYDMYMATNSDAYISNVNSSNVYNSGVYNSDVYNDGGYSACNAQPEDAHMYEGMYSDVREDIELDGYDGADETG